MTTWQGAWQIVKHEIRRDKLGLLFSLMFFTYVAVILIPIFNERLESEAMGQNWLLDFMYLSLLPNLGFVMNRTMFRYWRDDPFTKKIAAWRTMPISPAHIAAARFILLSIVLIAGWLYFFSLEYIFISAFHEKLSFLQYIGFAAFWLGYALIFACQYVYLELGFSGKFYVSACFVYFALFGLLTYLINLSGDGAVFGVIKAVQNGQWWISALSLAVAVVALLFTNLMLRKRLAKRNLLN
ncbi:hypothetical protein [Paenibacillus abyssi]|uniref:Uncharacterized protein n=2 Tax=Paenibacillus abyssi TaxID=1340531 RepID=A0A917G0R9_9BACL|nr:hypothetical protein [Paenibacillus abyssi]GGG16293.1 hypothetical protein GCM10010916_36510 [Paenibacillus abyssi]